MELRVCKKCEEEKDISLFVRKKRGTEYYFLYTCKECNSIYNSKYYKKYYESNKEHLRAVSKEWAQNNKEQNRVRAKEWYYTNKDKKSAYDRTYRENNRECINKRLSKYRKDKRDSDPTYKLRVSVSRTIHYYIKCGGGSKDNESILDFIPFTIDELKNHLENQFEDWMNWDNWGTYRIEDWDDEDQSTWVWHIDHIVPQSQLPYSSMLDENFIKCWSLDNLRPLSAKENIEKADKNGTTFWT